jgi:hypothetical protein
MYNLWTVTSRAIACLPCVPMSLLGYCPRSKALNSLTHGARRAIFFSEGRLETERENTRQADCIPRTIAGLISEATPRRLSLILSEALHIQIKLVNARLPSLLHLTPQELANNANGH